MSETTPTIILFNILFFSDVSRSFLLHSITSLGHSHISFTIPTLIQVTLCVCVSVCVCVCVRVCACVCVTMRLHHLYSSSTPTTSFSSPQLPHQSSSFLSPYSPGGPALFTTSPGPALSSSSHHEIQEWLATHRFTSLQPTFTNYTGLSHDCHMVHM